MQNSLPFELPGPDISYHIIWNTGFGGLSIFVCVFDSPTAVLEKMWRFLRHKYIYIISLMPNALPVVPINAECSTT